MPTKTATITVNIGTPRFAWYISRRTTVRVLGVQLPRLLRAALFFVAVRYGSWGKHAISEP
jgi:hypothetical protein